MRVVLFCDMEGVSGIHSWDQVGGGSPLYDEGRELYTEEVNAAVRGCLAAGATSVIAQDGHGGPPPNCRSFMNWKPAKLQPGAEYVRGYRWGSFVEPFESGECDAIGFVGAHARAGMEDAVLSHTVNADGWYSVRLNDVEIGESAIISAIAGSFGVPVGCIAGDHAACEELRTFLGCVIPAAPVKRGLGRYSARMLAPADARDLIEQRFREALATPDAWAQPYTAQERFVLRVELASPDRAKPMAEFSGVSLVGPRAVETEGATFWEAWSKLWKAT
ncbi:MAG: peptidase M55 [Armatimonadetes bacterium]|nr:peptidase M55 [Armatimonadota bacterium]